MILKLSLQISEVSHDSVSVVFALDDKTSSTVRYLMIRFSSVFSVHIAIQSHLPFFFLNIVTLLTGECFFSMGASVGGKRYSRADANTRRTSFTSTVWELSFKTGRPCIGHYCNVALLSGHPSRSSRQPLNVDTL